MGFKMSSTLLNKILPSNIDHITFMKNLKISRASYNHSENSFVVSASSQNLNYEDTGQSVANDKNTFNIDRDSFVKYIIKICRSQEPQHLKKTKKVVIDFSSPNIAKPFHAGHLRSTIIGNFIANINLYFKNDVKKINYLGDWGTQFGLLQYGLKAKNIDLPKLQNNAIKSLYDVYVYANKLALNDEKVLDEARKYFSDIEQGKTQLDDWKRIRQVTMQELEQIYTRLGIQFDAYQWESDFNGGAIKDLITSLETDGIIRTDESGKKYTSVNNKDLTVLKSDNSTLYLSRDIAALLDRFKKYDFDKMLYVVDNTQANHFTALFEIVKKFNEKCTDGCVHVKFGRLKGMSTRTGNVVFLNDILDEAKQKMHEKQKLSKNTRSSAMNDETCDTLGITAVLINDLKQRRQKDYVFEWDRALQSEGDSGIRLQYLHSRLWSLEQNSGAIIPNYCDPNYLPEEIVGQVVAELAKFENVLQRSYEEYEACILVGYLFRLAKYINRMFKEIRVKDVDAELASQRLLVFHSARLVIKTGLEILGVKALNEM